MAMTPIRPELGLQDWSPVARGGEAFGRGIGQGLAALGQGIGKGLEQKKANEQKNKQMMGSIKAMRQLMNSGVLNPALEAAGVRAEDLQTLNAVFDDPDKSLTDQYALTQQMGAFLNMAVAEGTKVLTAPQKPVPSLAGVDQLIKDATDKNGNVDPSALYSLGAQRGFTPDIIGQVADDLKKQSPLVTVDTGDKVTGRLMEQRYKSIQEQRETKIMPAVNAVPHLMAMEELLGVMDDKGGIIAGSLAKQELAVKALANRLGANFEDVERTQAYIGMSAKRVAEIIKDFGAGTGLSDADREFATAAAGGNITMDRRALKRLIDIAKKGMKTAHANYLRDVNRSFGGEGLEWERNSLLVPELSFDAMPENIEPLPSVNVPSTTDGGGEDDFWSFARGQ